MLTSSAVLTKWSPFFLSLAVDCLFFINLCSWIFKCGCKSLWNGADMACNIHMAHAKHCPFCAHGWQGQAVVMFAIIAPQLVISLKTPWTWLIRLLATLALFPVIEGLAALILGWSDKYWTP
jgi:hypothetical protein